MMENGVQECCSNAISSTLEMSAESASDISSLSSLCEDGSPIISTTEGTPTKSCLLDQKDRLKRSKKESGVANSMHTSDDSDPHQTIMSACSTVGQHIRQNITETLNSRVAGAPVTATDDITSSLLPAVIEKIENFENSLMEKLSETVDEAFDGGTLPGEMNGAANLLPGDESGTVSSAAQNSNITNKASSSIPSVNDSNVVSSSQDMQINRCEVSDSANSSRDLASETDFPDSDKCVVETSDISSSHNAIKTVCSEFGQQICQTITETLNSGVVESNTQLTAPSNFISGIQVTIMEKIHNFESVLVDKLSTIVDNAAVQNEIEETSSLSGEADVAEKDTVEEPNIQNDVSSENKVSSTSDNTTLYDKTSKKSQRNATNKKKGEKTIGFFTNQILKSLSGCATSDEKVNVLCRKHAETLDKLKTTELRLKQNERQVVQLSREKEQLQAEHNRNVLAKSRLEGLCRELQRQNKAVKDESLLRIREEEEKRKDVASKFQTTLNEISSLMQENSKKNLQLKEENGELAQKLKTLVEHYEMWEKHMEKVVQQKDLEAQLAKAKHAKTNLQLKQETEAFLREKQTLLENMSELQKKCTQLATNELQLRAELSDYTSKYEEFQTVLNKSNQVFASFKTDMDTTSKKIKKLEKETNIWKQKWESSNSALVEMISNKQLRDKELKNAQQRILTLEKLCRALQAERNDLQNQVKGNIVEENCNAPCEEGTQAC